MGWSEILLSMSDWLPDLRWWRKSEGPETSIEDLLGEITALISKNQVGYLEVEREASRVKVFEKSRVLQIQEGVESDHLKRIVLREIVSLRKRRVTLDRVGHVYQQNIDIHLAAKDRLEDQLAAGMKSLTTAQLEEIILDHKGLEEEHREIMASAATLIDTSEIDEAREDPELQALAKELEEKFNMQEASLE